MIHGPPLRANKRLRHGMKSSVPREGTSSKCTALDRQQEKITRYALLSFFGDRRYFIGPAKSVPITSNAVPPTVRSSGNCPGGGVVMAVALARLHPRQLFLTVFTRLRSLGTQYCSRTAAMVSPTPPCSVSVCTF